MLIDFKHISLLCLVSTLCHEKQVIWKHQIFLYSYHFFEIHFGSFWRIFEGFYNFAVIMDSFQTSFSEPYILNTPCLFWRLKVSKIHQNEICRFLPNSYLNLLKRSKIRLNWKIMNIKRSSAHGVHWKHVIFWGCAAWSYHIACIKIWQRYILICYIALKYDVEEIFKILLMYLKGL